MAVAIRQRGLGETFARCYFRRLPRRVLIALRAVFLLAFCNIVRALCSGFGASSHGAIPRVNALFGCQTPPRSIGSLSTKQQRQAYDGADRKLSKHAALP